MLEVVQDQEQLAGRQMSRQAIQPHATGNLAQTQGARDRGHDVGSGWRVGQVDKDHTTRKRICHRTGCRYHQARFAGSTWAEQR
jgi:hypothetical protein